MAKIGTYSSYVKFAGLNCVNVDNSPELQVALGRANSFWCPIGPAWGRGWLLMRRDDVKTIMAAPAWYALEFVGGPDKSNRVKLKKVRAIKSQRLTPGKPNSPNAVYLVEVVDKRYFAAKFSDTGTQDFRVRAAATDYYDLGVTDSTSLFEGRQAFLDDQINNLWATMSGILGAVPTIPDTVALESVVYNVRLAGQNAWYALNAILSHVGMALRYDPILDRFEFLDLRQGQADYPEKEIERAPLIMDADPLDEVAAWLPIGFETYFHFVGVDWGQEQDTHPGQDNAVAAGDGDPADTIIRNWAQHPYHSHYDLSELCGGATGGLSGTVLPVWNDRRAEVLRVYNSTVDTVANSTYLNAYAAEPVESKILIDHTGPRMRKQILGIVDWVKLGHKLRSVRWANYGPAGGGSSTTIEGHPGLPLDPDAPFGGVDKPVADGLSVADLARQSFPNYPRTDQLVQVWQIDPGDELPYANGTMLAPDGEAQRDSSGVGMHSGRVVRQTGTSGMCVYESCWIYFVDLLGDVMDGDGLVWAPQAGRYIGRLMGIEVGDADEVAKPLYCCVRGAIPTVKAVLSAQLDQSNTAAAEVLGVSGITIRDRYLLDGEHAVNGSTVVVMWDDEAGEWCAISGPSAP